MTPQGLEFLIQWYMANCDGEWEHESGIKIETLDNPGWRITVDLADTALEGVMQVSVIADRTALDWCQSWSDGASWNAACGSNNLEEALARFRTFALTKTLGDAVT